MRRRICPSCSTSTLDTYSIDNHELERCTRCHGIRFDEPELMAYIESHAHEPEKGFNLVSDDTHKGESVRYCYCCEKPMVKHELLENHSTEIDACHTCNTFWVDEEEIKHVQYTHDLRLALSEIHKGFSWKSWCFQLLLRMPVEYNAKPKTTPWVTYALVALNFLFFSVRYISPEMNIWMFDNFSAMVPVVDMQQFALSIVTAQFMHFDWFHLLGNLYFLWILGDNIEDAIGKRRYLLAYLICGAIGLLLEMAFAHIQGRPIFLMGASASVSGLFGMYLVWFRHAKLSVMLVVYQLRLPVIFFFGFWILENIWGLLSGSMGVAFLAHLSGFFAGLLFALLYKSKVYDRNPLLYVLNTLPNKNST